MKNKTAQIIGLSFQTIFALILIIFTIFVGFFVIKMFLERMEQANINDFIKNQLEQEIMNIWTAEESSKNVTLILSKKFDYICFVNQSRNIKCENNYAPPTATNFCQEYLFWTRNEKDNLILVPLGIAEKYGTYTSWHIACGTKECINWSKQQNPYCIPVDKGKVTIKFTKKCGNCNIEIAKA